MDHQLHDLLAHKWRHCGSLKKRENVDGAIDDCQGLFLWCYLCLQNIQTQHIGLKFLRTACKTWYEIVKNSGTAGWGGRLNDFCKTKGSATLLSCFMWLFEFSWMSNKYVNYLQSAVIHLTIQSLWHRRANHVARGSIDRVKFARTRKIELGTSVSYTTVLKSLSDEVREAQIRESLAGWLCFGSGRNGQEA